MDFCRQFRARSEGVLTLNIHRHASRMAELLPEARVIHLLRDPRDVARSAIGMGWAGTLYHGVDLWRDTEMAWDKVVPQLADSQALELRYEALCRNPEAELGRVCEFLGLSYDPAMLAIEDRSTYAPIDAGLAEQWRHKSSAMTSHWVRARSAR